MSSILYKIFLIFYICVLHGLRLLRRPHVDAISCYGSTPPADRVQFTPGIEKGLPGRWIGGSPIDGSRIHEVIRKRNISYGEVTAGYAGRALDSLMPLARSQNVNENSARAPSHNRFSSRAALGARK